MLKLSESQAHHLNFLNRTLIYIYIYLSLYIYIYYIYMYVYIYIQYYVYTCICHMPPQKNIHIHIHIHIHKLIHIHIHSHIESYKPTISVIYPLLHAPSHHGRPDNLERLVTDAYGHNVLRALLVHGSEDQLRRIVALFAEEGKLLVPGKGMGLGRVKILVILPSGNLT